MKKICVMILVCIMCFSSCSNSSHSDTEFFSEKTYNYVVKVDGIDNYKSPEGYYELNAHILPIQDFITKFEYINADYHFREHYESKWDFCGYEKSIVIIEYDNITYEKAKEFCVENMSLSENYSLFLNDFVFLENLETAIAQEREESAFPRDFNMFVYNDSLKCLVFMGYYNPDYTNEDAMFIIKNWDKFLEIYFSDVYDFSKTTQATE